MPPITLSAEFSLLPDNTVLGPSFTIAGFTFTDLSGSPSFVNESGSEKGLQFERTGIRVQLPATSDGVDIRGAAFAGPYDIEGKNAAGSTLAVARIPGDHAPHNVTLNHPGISYVDFIGGGNEGLIEAVSITVCKQSAGTSGTGTSSPEFLQGSVSGLDVQAGAGIIPIAFAFVTPDDGDEIQVRTTSLQLLVALATVTGTDDSVEVTYEDEDGVKILTRLRILDRN
jgi:hypothetical protein